jgi:hypothetical protein
MGQSRSLSYDPPAQLLATMRASAADTHTGAIRSHPKETEMIIDCGAVSKKTRGVFLLLFLEGGLFPLFLW